MERISNRSMARLAVSFSAAALVALGTALPSFADKPSASLVVNAGALGAGVSFADFVPVTLNGSAQRPTTSLLLTNIVDSTGSGAGWRLSVSMSQFSDGGGTPKLLALSSLIVQNQPVVTLQDPTSSALSTITRGAGLQALTPLDTGVSITLLDAAASGGMGSYNVAPLQLALNLPATTALATYSSTATVTISTGP